MKWYKHHIGDWAKDTGHLSMLESGAYARLIAVYYRTEKCLPKELPQIFKLVGCHTPQDRIAVKSVLDEFFREQSDGYHQSRCDKEIIEYQTKSEKARTSALTRWTKPNHANASTLAMRTHSDGNANQEPRYKDLVVRHPTRTADKLQNLMKKALGQEPETENPENDITPDIERNREIARKLTTGETSLTKP